MTKTEFARETRNEGRGLVTRTRRGVPDPVRGRERTRERTRERMKERTRTAPTGIEMTETRRKIAGIGIEIKIGTPGGPEDQDLPATRRRGMSNANNRKGNRISRLQIFIYAFLICCPAPSFFFPFFLLSSLQEISIVS